MDSVKELYSQTEEALCRVAMWKEYRAAKPKVLFILKEPATRGENSKNYNFQEGLQDPKWKQLRMWRLLAYCSEGLQAIGRGEEPRSAFEKKSAEECKKLLRYSSYMNLKRFGAGRKSDMSLVGLHAGLFWPLMLEEIKKLEPEIIVCCGTGSILVELLKCLNRLPEYVSRLGYEECGTIKEKHGVEQLALWSWGKIRQEPMSVIKVAHPGRKNYKEYFEKLMELGNKVLRKRGME